MADRDPCDAAPVTIRAGERHTFEDGKTYELLDGRDQMSADEWGGGMNLGEIVDAAAWYESNYYHIARLVSSANSSAPAPADDRAHPVAMDRRTLALV